MFESLQSFTGDGVVGGVSPNNRLYSQSYPSIYSPDGTSQQGIGQNGNRERERSATEVERGRQRAGIVDLEEEGEEAEEEEEDMEERRPYGNESAGEADSFSSVLWGRKSSFRRNRFKENKNVNFSVDLNIKLEVMLGLKRTDFHWDPLPGAEDPKMLLKLEWKSIY